MTINMKIIYLLFMLFTYSTITLCQAKKKENKKQFILGEIQEDRKSVV